MTFSDVEKAETANLDLIFGALSDPTRRALLDLMKNKEMGVMELASSFEMTFQAVSKHLKVLDRAGLIHRRKEGRSFLIQTNASTLSEAIKWMSFHYDFWKGSFRSLEHFLDQLDENES